MKFVLLEANDMNDKDDLCNEMEVHKELDGNGN